jgi:transcriptional regulator with XRE-family HTH domain
MDFKSATDELTESTGLTLTRVAEELGITLNSVSRMRSGVLKAPAGWQAVLAKLAKEHARDMATGAQRMAKFAAELERAAGSGSGD